MGKYYKKIDKTFAPGEIIFTENSDCDGMYIIETGRIRVFKTVETPTGHRELELIQLGPKSLFGEMALIDDKKRSASVQALEETKCTIITRQMFDDQIEQLPSWVVNLIRVLVARLRDTNDKLRQKAQQFQDDTGGLVIVDGKEGGRAKEMKDKLEGAIEKAERKLKDISSSIDEVRSKELKVISEIAGGEPEKEANSDPIGKIQEKAIREIRDNVNRLDRVTRKPKEQGIGPRE